jgi:hypothetical protein
VFAHKKKKVFFGSFSSQLISAHPSGNLGFPKIGSGMM